MQLEHPARITGSPSTTEARSVWNVSSQLQIYKSATTTTYYICSSSIYYFINDVRRNDICRGYRILFNATHSKYDYPFRYNTYTIYITCCLPDWMRSPHHTLVQQNHEQVVQNETYDAELFLEISLVRKSTKFSIPIDVLGNTAFNYFHYYKTRYILPVRSVFLKNEKRFCINLLDYTITETNSLEQCPLFTTPHIFSEWKVSEDWRETYYSGHKTNRLQNTTTTKKEPNNLSLAEHVNTASIGETIRKTLHFRKYEKREVDECPRRKVSGGSYGLLLLLYFLALPLLCSTFPSTGIITSVSFVQKSLLVHTDNNTVHHLSPAAGFRSAGSHIDVQSNKEHPQGRKPIHPYNEYTWEVNQINPWLSACDLAGPAPADLQGSCGPPEVPKYCPIPCSSSINSDRIFREVVERLVVPKKWRTGSAAKIQWKTFDRTDTDTMAPDQCLFYLEESHKRDICREDFARSSSLSFSTSRENRYWFLSGLRLRHCCENAVINALAPGDGGPLEDVLNGSPRCVSALDKILSVDALAARLHCEFEEVLARYDCRQSYSVIHNCTHCKEAYRKWVCSSLVPYFAHEGPSISLNSVEIYVGTRLRPCRSFCQSVEQRCPYLLPGDRAPAYPTQYAGEPTFLCRDPNIPETGGQAVRALHGDEGEECCFRVCSDDAPGLGVCANCTDNKPHGRRIGRDPPSAPHCEMTNVVHSHFADPRNNAEDRPELSLSAPVSTTSASSSFCVSGGTDSAPSLSSSSSHLALPSVPISLLCLLWIWVTLISVYQMAFPLSLALKAELKCNVPFWLVRNDTRTVSKSTAIKYTLSIIKSPIITTVAQKLSRVMFYNLAWILFVCRWRHWYYWLLTAYRCTSKIFLPIFELRHLPKRVNLREQDNYHHDRDTGSFPFDRWCYCRHSLSIWRKVRISGGRLKRRRRRQYWFSTWKWEESS
ncbi:uncharacterized protein Mid1 [Fopius arisanus]|uniref:Fam155b_0 protein n=1 Tax=Fopius arisanus TaxID=64838 RepID=A0A0C9RIK5_9HYME|nr:PREDICTED: uncharacterized protein LOC105267482 [Fopius arisanus]